MDMVETAKVMAILHDAYPNFYRNVTPDDRNSAIKLWHRCFSSDDYGRVSAAVLALIKTRTSTYPPSVGEVTEQMQVLFSPENITELEAWRLVNNALKNSLYNSKEEFEKLPPVVQKAVGDACQLREWALMDEDVVKSVIASNFQRSFRVECKRALDFQSLPENIRQFVIGSDSVAKRMIDDDTGKKLQRLEGA